MTLDDKVLLLAFTTLMALFFVLMFVHSCLSSAGFWRAILP